MTFAEKSKDLRYEYNLTQAELAKEIKVSRSCVSMIEIGKNEPTASTLIAYSNYFKIPVDELLGRENFTPEERAAGASATKKISITPIEDEMLYRFREIGKRHGIDAQQALITIADKML